MKAELEYSRIQIFQISIRSIQFNRFRISPNHGAPGLAAPGCTSPWGSRSLFGSLHGQILHAHACGSHRAPNPSQGENRTLSNYFFRVAILLKKTDAQKEFDSRGTSWLLFSAAPRQPPRSRPAPSAGAAHAGRGRRARAVDVDGGFCAQRGGTRYTVAAAVCCGTGRCTNSGLIY